MQENELVNQYISDLNTQYRTTLAREHSYRPALQEFLSGLLPKCTVTNEPARTNCGSPDYIITRKSDNLAVAFIEAKDIDDTDLDGKKQHKEQFSRYKDALETIIFTDYLDFHLYRDGEFVDAVRLAQCDGKKISLLKENVEKFLLLIQDFAESGLQPVTNAKKLAKTMAGKARLLADVIYRAILEEESGENPEKTFTAQMEAFRNILIHDLTPLAFSDIYAQTIAYGLFAARLHSKSEKTFTRQEAATLIPSTNPFLRKIFQNIAAFDLDERIAWIVDDLAGVFSAIDIEKMMATKENLEAAKDPMIHFYEDFLSEYNPSLRKSRGVWYTPLSVVDFIVSSVDEILKSDFSLPLGLADYSKIQREVVVEGANDKKGKEITEKREFHRVQILDPAAGTGTFLCEVVNKIYDKFKSDSGMWQNYVEEHLLPRVNGFELLMASYAIAHLKLDMQLQKTGFVAGKKSGRIRVYLTNSLEEYNKETGTLFAQWLAQEASEASRIKRDCPVMCLLGNPPYSVSSSNNSPWITSLLEEYKKGLDEKNIQPLSDDYIKFIRLGQHYIEKNGEGILAYISNNSFLDGLIHRRMRKSLMETFDKIYILNLHGNSRRKETSPDGSKDENVFDIMQGVSVNIFVKERK